MKKIVVLIFALALSICLFGCNGGEAMSGGGKSEITGCTVNFYYGVASLGSFNSSVTEEKEITLSTGTTYEIGLRPTFRGSKEAVYVGDCAKFSFPDGAFEISYIGDTDHEPRYELKVLCDTEAELTVDVDGYVQRIKISPS